MSKIYIVVLGSKYEGYTILSESAYSSHESAKQFCLEYIANDDLFPTLGEWAKQEHKSYWCRSHGHDYLTIIEMDLLK